MIDSHTHLDRLPIDTAEAVAAARGVGVRTILTIGTGAESSRRALAAAEAHPEVYAAVGHHPNSATGYTDAITDELRELAAHPRCRAIGESGLDYFRDYAPRADQERAFAAQIGLARETGKPLIVHTRAADDDTIDILAADAVGVTVVLHCFSMPDRVNECLGQGWTISFAGNITYPANEALAEASTTVPLDSILVETDAPFLTPQPMRRQKNQPAFVTETASFIAERRGIPYQELEAAVEANAARLFGW